ARRRAAQRLRHLARALRDCAPGHPAAVRRRRDAVTSRASRRPRSRRPARRRPNRCLHCALAGGRETSEYQPRAVNLFFELLGVAGLILLNAFFVAAEYGLVTARRTRIIELQHQGNRRARDVLRITSDPPRF